MSNTTAHNSPAADPPPGDNVHPLPNGAAQPEPSHDPAEARQTDKAVLDNYEALERSVILDDEDEDELGGKDEIAAIPIVKKMPKFTRFRVNPETVFDMLATTDEAGMESTIIAVSKEFARS